MNYYKQRPAVQAREPDPGEPSRMKARSTLTSMPEICPIGRSCQNAGKNHINRQQRADRKKVTHRRQATVPPTVRNRTPRRSNVQPVRSTSRSSECAAAGASAALTSGSRGTLLAAAPPHQYGRGGGAAARDGRLVMAPAVPTREQRHGYAAPPQHKFRVYPR